MRTPLVKWNEIDRPDAPEFQRRWYVVDAAGVPLGRTASRIASVLRGKHRAIFTPNVDCGDVVVVVNADKIELTGSKLEGKHYYRHSGWPGGFKDETAKQLLARKPTELMRIAVQGMLPKNRLARKLIRKLKIYAGPDHPHQAQKPVPLPIDRGE